MFLIPLPTSRRDARDTHQQLGSVSLRLSVLALAASLMAALGGCSRPEPAPEPIRSVRLMTVGESTRAVHYEFAGEVRARVESSLGFRVAGKLTRRPAEVGIRVRAGELLAQIDPQDYQLAADAARAQVIAATTQRDLAQADFKRFAALRDQNFISAAELERRDTALRAAQAQLDQAEAQLKAQANQGRYTQLLADAGGVITAVAAEPGQVLAAGTPVVRLAHDGPRDVVIAVPEDRLSRFKVGQSAQVQVWGGGASLTAQVREVAASADPVTRTFQVKLSLAAKAEAPALGATVNVIPELAPIGSPKAIKVPTSALRREGQGTAVWVYEPASQTVRLQAVHIATAEGNEAVIASGLQAGQQVVTAGVHVLQPGQRVSIYGAQPAEASGASAARAAASTSKQ